MNEGAQYVQIDAPRYSYYIDPKWRGYVKTEMGLDPEQALDEAIRTDNACLAGAGTAFYWRFIYVAATIAANGTPKAAMTPSPRIFGQLNVDAFLLEYESERAGTFEPLRFVPRGKTVVLGLVSSKLAEMESPDHLARRIDEASKYVPLENLGAQPAVRLCVDDGRQSAHRRAAVAKTWIGLSKLRARCGERFSFDALVVGGIYRRASQLSGKGGIMRRSILVSFLAGLALFALIPRATARPSKSAP